MLENAIVLAIFHETDLILPAEADDRVYFVHSFKAMPTEVLASFSDVLVRRTAGGGCFFLSRARVSPLFISDHHKRDNFLCKGDFFVQRIFFYITYYICIV